MSDISLKDMAASAVHFGHRVGGVGNEDKVVDLGDVLVGIELGRGKGRGAFFDGLTAAANQEHPGCGQQQQG